MSDLCEPVKGIDICGWPPCTVSLASEPLFQFGELDDRWFCADHVTDDFLPALVVGGPLRACASCGEGTARATADEASVALHTWCRRAHFEALHAPPRRGAYARHLRVVTDG